jgi:hypothetical protein
MNFPDLIPYLKGEHIPVSPVLLRQIGNKLNDWDDHGTPILLRGLRTLLHEEKLLASQDAIAERLYSPMILAKLGIRTWATACRRSSLVPRSLTLYAMTSTLRCRQTSASWSTTSDLRSHRSSAASRCRVWATTSTASRSASCRSSASTPRCFPQASGGQPYASSAFRLSS